MDSSAGSRFFESIDPDQRQPFEKAQTIIQKNYFPRQCQEFLACRDQHSKEPKWQKSCQQEIFSFNETRKLLKESSFLMMQKYALSHCPSEVESLTNCYRERAADGVGFEACQKEDFNAMLCGANAIIKDYTPKKFVDPFEKKK